MNIPGGLSTYMEGKEYIHGGEWVGPFLGGGIILGSR
jgi:hypothetical protein